MLSLVEEIYEDRIARVRGEVYSERKRDIIDEWKKSNYDYERLTQTFEKVRELCGYSATTSDYAFERWFRDNVGHGIPTETRKDLERSYRHLGEVVKRHGLLPDESEAGGQGGAAHPDPDPTEQP
jgi:hypothetical protein